MTSNAITIVLDAEQTEAWRLFNCDFTRDELAEGERMLASVTPGEAAEAEALLDDATIARMAAEAVAATPPPFEITNLPLANVRGIEQPVRDRVNGRSPWWYMDYPRTHDEVCSIATRYLRTLAEAGTRAKLMQDWGPRQPDTYIATAILDSVDGVVVEGVVQGGDRTGVSVSEKPRIIIPRLAVTPRREQV